MKKKLVEKRNEEKTWEKNIKFIIKIIYLNILHGKKINKSPKKEKK